MLKESLHQAERDQIAAQRAARTATPALQQGPDVLDDPVDHLAEEYYRFRASQAAGGFQDDPADQQEELGPPVVPGAGQIDISHLFPKKSQ